MFASQIIKELSELILTHGDATVSFFNGNEYDIDWIEIDEDFDKADEYVDPTSVKKFIIG